MLKVIQELKRQVSQGFGWGHFESIVSVSPFPTCQWIFLASYFPALYFACDFQVLVSRQNSSLEEVFIDVQMEMEKNKKYIFLSFI